MDVQVPGLPHQVLGKGAGDPRRPSGAARAADHDPGGVAVPRQIEEVFADLQSRRRQGKGLAAEPFGQSQVLLGLFLVLFLVHHSPRPFDVDRHPGGTQGRGHAGSGADDLAAIGVRPDRGQDPFRRRPGLLDPFLAHVPAHVGVHPVRGLAQGHFAEGEQVALAEEAGNGTAGLVGHIDLALLEPGLELLHRDVHQLDLVGALEHRVGHGLADQDAGDLGDRVAVRLEMLHVDRGVDVDASVQQFEHVLPALAVAGAGALVWASSSTSTSWGCRARAPSRSNSRRSTPR